MKRTMGPAPTSRSRSLRARMPSLGLALLALVVLLGAAPAAHAAGACCINGTCVVMGQGDCVASGGVFHGEGTNCDNTVCEGATGACCVNSSQGRICRIFTSEHCAREDGTYHGDGTPCTPNL